MPQLRVALLPALLALLFAAPSAHAATQAWDIEAVDGQFSMKMNVDDPLQCGDVSSDDGDKWDQVSRATYSARFANRPALRKPGPWLKYAPAWRGPITTVGFRGIAMRVEADSEEWQRVLYPGEPEYGTPCRLEPDQRCVRSRTSRKARGRLWAETKGKRTWIGFGPIGSPTYLPSCGKDHSDTLHPDYPSGAGSPDVEQAVPVSTFRRRNVVLRFKGSRPVRHRSGSGFWSSKGTLTWSWTVKMRKVVIDEDCRERSGGSPFVCRL